MVGFNDFVAVIVHNYSQIFQVHHASAENGPATKRIKLESAGEGADTTAAPQQPIDDTASTIALPSLDQQAAFLNPEQLAALTQMPMGITPELLAAIQATGPDGQPLPMIGDIAQLDANSIAQLAAMGNLNSLGMDTISSLPPEQIQAILASNSLPFMMPGMFGGVDADSTYKNWWDEKDEQELLRIATDKEYRMETIGTEELDWAKLEAHFNRTANALRKKCWVLTKGKAGTPGRSGPEGSQDGSPSDMAGNEAAAAAAAAAAMAQAQAIQSAFMPALDPQVAAAMANVGVHMGLSSPPAGSGKGGRAERKNWTEIESQDMARIVADPVYRTECGLVDGEEEVSWDRLALRFGCSVQTAKRKYRNTQEQMAQGGGLIPEKAKRQHFRKSVPYRWMIVSAISKIPGLEATAPQIFENIEADPELRQQLDLRIMPGTKHVPRWKIQVRKVLSADNIFINTGGKQKHETIWRLDPVALQDSNADRQRQRAGLPPLNLSSTDLPAVPALVNPGATAESMSAQAMMQQINDSMAMLQNPQLHGMHFGDPSAIMPQLAGLENMAGMLDPATLSAMVASGMDPQALGLVTAGLPGQEDANAAMAAAAMAAALSGQPGFTPGLLPENMAAAVAAMGGTAEGGEAVKAEELAETEQGGAETEQEGAEQGE